MKVLVFGPSGAGKTYVSHALHQLGYNAFDADEVEGLSAWYDPSGRKVAPPKTAEEAFQNHYSFLWSRKFLKGFLQQYEDVFLFGGSGNTANLFDLFDKVFFLKVDPALQKERLLHASRKNPQMDIRLDEVVVWGAWLEEMAAKRNIPFIDASLTPVQILDAITRS